MDASALQLIILPAGIIAVLFAIYLARDVLSRDTGTKEMQDVAGTIFEGAVAFIRRQYTTIGILAVVGAFVIAGVITIFETEKVADTKTFGLDLGWRTGIAFLVGAACSMASGIIGMYISVKSNVRTAAAARRSLVEAVQVAMRGGAVSGLPRRRPVAARRVRHLQPVRRARRWPGHPRRAVPHRRLRLRRLVRRAVRPARRRDLHEGRRRRLRPRRQGRGGHPRGRPAQRGRHRGPRRRQRRRLRRPRRGPVRVDRRREHRGDDPRRRRLRDRPHARAGRTRPPGSSSRSSSAPSGSSSTIVAIFFVRGTGRREPDEHAQPRLLGHDDPVRRPRCCSSRTSCSRRTATRRPGLPVWCTSSRAGVVGLATSVAFVYITQYYTAGHVPTRPGDRRGVQDRPRDQHHLGHRGRLRDDVRDRDHDRHRPLRQPLARLRGAHRRTPTARTSAASSGPRSRRWACS